MSLDALLAADFKTKPWDHQRNEFESHCETSARALLWQMRSGKTKAVVDKSCHLFRVGLIDCVLVFAPNGVHENWVVREFPAHVWDSVAWLGVYWQTRVAGVKAGARLGKEAYAKWAAARSAWWSTVRGELKTPSGRLLVITFNSESVTREDIRKLVATIVRKRRVHVVFDESTDYRTPGSARSKMMRALKRRCPFRTILDGTAAHNSPLHLYSQFELLDDAALGYTKAKSFRNRYGVYKRARGYGGRAIWKLVGYQRLDELKARTAKYASVVLREDCVDMPPLVPRTREFAMSAEQVDAYRQMLDHTMVELEGGLIELNEQPNKILKLQQIANGFVIDKHKDVHLIPGPTPRLDALDDEVFLAPGKVIVWCSFHVDMDQVINRIKALDIGDVLEYTGRVTGEAKLHARTRFQNDEAVKALVGHPQAGGRGVEFSAASTVIWYSHTFNAIHRAQANERATKMGGGNVSLVDIVGAPVDRYILKCVDEGISVADDVVGRGLKAVLQEVAL